jgi:alkylresorcinol/alkylpyrone synthase
MLEVVGPKASAAAVTGGFDVEILSVATANPSFELSQTEATRRAKEIFPHLKALWPLYDNTGIELRYNCQPVEWYLKPHSWEERTAIFQKHALDLLADVTLKATASAGVALEAIDILVTNTITGLAIPSLDAKLFNRLKLKSTVERLPIFGLGCGGGVAGLARATRLAHATEGLPLALGLPAYALFFSVLNAGMLAIRITTENAALLRGSQIAPR